MARPTRTSRRRRATALAATLATGFAGTAVLLAPTTSSASSHREAPAIADDRNVDNTDVYAFVSPDDDDTVTLVGNFWPFEEPDGGPNFYRFADDGSQYDINIDSNGDALPDKTYRWTFRSEYRTQETFLYNTGVVDSFDDPDLNFRQFYDLVEISFDAARTASTRLLLGDAPVAPSNVGPASMPDYPTIREGTLRAVSNGGQSFAGQADDAFFLDLRVFDLLYGADFSEVGVDTLDGYNVQTLALKVPKTDLALNGDPSADGNPVIGVWSTTSKPTTRVLPPTDSDSFTVNVSAETTQVSRLGNPLVNEVVIPIRDKDLFNSSQPVNDADNFLNHVQVPIVPQLVEAIYDIPAPPTPREDLVEVFLTGICDVEGCPMATDMLDVNLNSQLLNRDVQPAQFVPSEMLRLNMSVPPTPSADASRLGVIGGDLAGFPNGRRLIDDVVDIELQVLEGALLGRDVSTIGDAVDNNDVPFLNRFPYVAQPHEFAVNRS
jgi:hypothetical protein